MVFSNHIYFQLCLEKDLEKSKKKKGGVSVGDDYYIRGKFVTKV